MVDKARVASESCSDRPTDRLATTHIDTAVLLVFSVYCAFGCMDASDRHTPASPTSSPPTTTTSSSCPTIHSFWLLAAGFAVIGLIASALQMQRTKRVIAYGRVAFSSSSSPPPYSAIVNNECDSSDGCCEMHSAAINTLCRTFATWTWINIIQSIRAAFIQATETSGWPQNTVNCTDFANIAVHPQTMQDPPPEWMACRPQYITLSRKVWYFSVNIIMDLCINTTGTRSWSEPSGLGLQDEATQHCSQQLQPQPVSVYTAYSNPSHSRSWVERVYLNPVRRVCAHCLWIFLYVPHFVIFIVYISVQFAFVDSWHRVV